MGNLFDKNSKKDSKGKNKNQKDVHENSDLNANTEVKTEVNSNANLNVEGNKMSEEKLNVAEAVSAAVSPAVDENNYVVINRELKFRNQLRYDEETGAETRLPGVEYFENEKDKDGNDILENGEPKQIVYRGKPGLRRKPIIVPVRYPLLSYFGISTEVSGEFNRAATNYPKAEFQTLFEVIQSTVDDALDNWMGNEKTAGTPPTFDQLSWETIAATPKSSRKTIQISREDLLAAIESYCEIMQSLGKPQRGIEITQQVFKTRCRQAFTMDPKAVGAIRGNLGLWFETISDEKKAEYQDVYAFLDNQLAQAIQEVDITDIL